MDSRLYQDLLETANAQCELIKNNYVNNKCLYNWVCYRFVCQEHVIRLKGVPENMGNIGKSLKAIIFRNISKP